MEGLQVRKDCGDLDRKVGERLLTEARLLKVDRVSEAVDVNRSRRPPT